jgi:hypothetical protein
VKSCITHEVPCKYHANTGYDGDMVVVIYGTIVGTRINTLVEPPDPIECE